MNKALDNIDNFQHKNVAGIAAYRTTLKMLIRRLGAKTLLPGGEGQNYQCFHTSFLEEANFQNGFINRIKTVNMLKK